MAEHTKGPWMAWNMPSAGWQVGTKAQFDRRSKGEMVGYGNIAGLAFYQCRPGHDGGPFITTAQEESEAADAHLLAAAPAMLETLELAKVALIHDVPGSCWATGPLTGDAYEDLVVCPGCRALMRIDEAIAKARGTT